VVLSEAGLQPFNQSIVISEPEYGPETQGIVDTEGMGGRGWVEQEKAVKAEAQSELVMLQADAWKS
jgi:hypothetical protein